MEHPRRHRRAPAAPADLAHGRRREHRHCAAVVDEPADEPTLRLLHRTIADSARGHGEPAVQHLHRQAHRAQQPPHPGLAGTTTPREVAEPLVLMLAPLAPHIAEELWTARARRVAGLARLPGGRSGPPGGRRGRDPGADRGKVRARISVPVDADAAVLEAAARSEPKVAELLAGATVRRVVAVPGRLVNFVARLTTVRARTALNPNCSVSGSLLSSSALTGL